MVRVGEVPDRLNTAAAPEHLPCTHSAGCLGAQLRLVTQDDAVGAVDAYIEARVPVSGLRLDVGVETVIFGVLRDPFLAGEVFVGLVADGLLPGFPVVGGQPYAVTLDEVHGDAPAAEVPAVGADEPALFDGDTLSHAQERVQEVLALRDAEVGAVQVEVAAGRFVVDGVTEEVFIAVALKLVVHWCSPQPPRVGLTTLRGGSDNRG
ncbi:hypothetical protein [Streptomyces coeruleorubidus]|uniref:Uncharacterized protein n=1 Tax=Streptomyces coeruleorubidus TaxID=116188 RepID=A0ABZ0KSB0_STRC4|nr:hypothetical protein [Streptomyces coeruleorubidus]WOT40744.1 hypothetical protein R5U08_42450 [Streptomyces coeruleorubidus]